MEAAEQPREDTQLLPHDDLVSFRFFIHQFVFLFNNWVDDERNRSPEQSGLAAH